MENLDLEGFERYCKNIYFVKSIGSYKRYLRQGLEVLQRISSNTLQEFFFNTQENSQYLKTEFIREIKNYSLHSDLYNDFKSALKKYMDFINKIYPLSQEGIEKQYYKVYKNIKNNGFVKLKTHNGSLFTVETNSTSLCVKGDDGNGQECMSVSLEKILRILFENEKYTYPSYEPSVINYIFGLITPIDKIQITQEQEEFYKKLADEFGLMTRKPHLSSGRQYFQIYPKNTPVSEGTGGIHYEFIVRSNKIFLELHLEKNTRDKDQLKKYLDIGRNIKRIDITSMTENEIREKFRELYNQYEEKINHYYQLDTTMKEKALIEEKEVNLQALNQILYGPPGTGKTYKINKLKEHFIYKESSITDVEWAKQIVDELTWFEVVSLVLYDLNKEAKVPEIAKHELIIAKAELLNKKKGVPQQIWAALQTHTILESTTVNYKTRVEPLVFDKLENSIWKLLDGFEEKTPELLNLYDKYKNKKPLSQELHNYEFITFHQSYGYEEFVEGIKAIPAGEVGNEDDLSGNGWCL